MRGSRRTIAAAVALVFLGALLEAHLHRAFARHGFCSEHGEPIHLGQAPARATASDQTAVQRAPSPEHGEHGCAELSFISQSIEDGGDAVIAAIEATPASALPRAAEPRRAIDQLTLAPKGSPPPT